MLRTAMSRPCYGSPQPSSTSLSTRRLRHHAGGAEAGLSVPPATDFRAITAAGVRGQVEGKVGGRAQALGGAGGGLGHGGIRSDLAPHCARTGQTVLAVLLDRKLFGLIIRRRHHSARVCGAGSLAKTAGVQQVLMLTGDNQGTARAIAARVESRNFTQGCCPRTRLPRSRRCAPSTGCGHGRRRHQRCASAGSSDGRHRDGHARLGRGAGRSGCGADGR